GLAGLNGPLSYTPVLASGPTDTMQSSLISKGVSGTLVLNQGLTNNVVLTNAVIRLSPDRQTAFLRLGGRPEIALTADPALGPATITGGAYGRSLVLSVPSLLLNTGPDFALIAYTEGSVGGFGQVGIETPVAGLPVGTGVYSGSWGGQVYPNSTADALAGGGDVINGQMDLTVNFQTGALSGDLYTGFTTLVGSVSGSASGNAVSGNFNLTSGT
ncbi:MAG: hypothetical protein KJO15_14245, partial [Alphaproteobacteria bacterium]|nr:hypothetical protein [Alphaproteobacteria bacterium]